MDGNFSEDQRIELNTVRRPPIHRATFPLFVFESLRQAPLSWLLSRLALF